MTNEVIWAVVITGEYAVQSSPREKHNRQVTSEVEGTLFTVQHT